MNVLNYEYIENTNEYDSSDIHRILTAKIRA